jgi:predicted Fe-Mo cluster-binding NifX family protein
MKVGFPVEYNFGLESRVYEHFGSAPLFLIVDSESFDFQAVPNRRGGNGDCHQWSSLLAQGCRGVVVEGIGKSAFEQLRQAGVAIYRGCGMRIADALAMLRSQRLEKLDCPMESRSKLVVSHLY